MLKWHRLSIRNDLIILLVTFALTASCGGKTNPASPIPQLSIDTSPHENLNVVWGVVAPGVLVDVSWRFISATTGTDGVTITGAWTLTFKNTGTTGYSISLTRLTFEDSKGFQISEYSPLFGYVDNFDLLGVSLFGGVRTNVRQGNFSFTVPSMSITNSITNMSVWAIFTKK